MRDHRKTPPLPGVYPRKKVKKSSKRSQTAQLGSKTVNVPYFLAASVVVYITNT
jgi:hypothetical protein